jgi:hypothetical protein
MILSHDEIKKNIKKRVQQDKVKELTKYNKQLEAALLAKEKEMEAVVAIGSTEYDYKIIGVNNKSKYSATAFILASDFHAEEEIKAKTVNYLNSFNLDIADKRITKFFLNSLRILEIQKKDVHLDKVVLCLLGDFISGAIHDELMETCQLRPVEAIIWVMQRLEAGIKLIVEAGYDLLVCCAFGNHSRIRPKTHYSTFTGHSLEQFMYYFLKDKFPNIQFIIAEGYHLYLQVYDYIIRLHHGDGIRYWGGISGIFTPMYKAIGQWNKGRPAKYDLCGHWHTLKNGGNFITNGSLIGFSPYSIRIKADFEPPLQKFFMLLSNGLIAGEYPIILE